MVSKVLNGESAAASGRVVFDFGISLGDIEQGQTNRAIGSARSERDQLNLGMAIPSQYLDNQSPGSAGILPAKAARMAALPCEANCETLR